MNPLSRGPAAAAAVVTRRIEITVEREWSEVVVPAKESGTGTAPARPDKELS